MNILHPGSSVEELIYFFGVARLMTGGPHVILLPERSIVASQRLAPVRCLAARCFSWIKDVRIYNNILDGVDVDMTGYGTARGNHSLMAGQALWAGVENLDPRAPWLVLPRASIGGKVVLCRTLMKTNSLFAWRHVLSFYRGERLVFCGSAEEHQAFRTVTGADLPWEDSSSLERVAELVSSARVVVGNSNEVMAVAEACKAPVVVELSVVDPDCVFNRPNAHYAFSGKVVLPGLRPGVAPATIEAVEPLDLLEAALTLSKAPPCWWWYPRRGQEGVRNRDMMFYTRGQAVLGVKEHYGLRIPDAVVEEAVVRYTVSKHPEDFLPFAHQRLFHKVLLAFREAGVQIAMLDYFTIPKIEPLPLC
jgi:hypothetical protein